LIEVKEADHPSSDMTLASGEPCHAYYFFACPKAAGPARRPASTKVARRLAARRIFSVPYSLRIGGHVEANV
jgi:hypothetical protein